MAKAKKAKKAKESYLWGWENDGGTLTYTIFDCIDDAVVDIKDATHYGSVVIIYRLVPVKRVRTAEVTVEDI